MAPGLEGGCAVHNLNAPLPTLLHGAPLQDVARQADDADSSEDDFEAQQLPRSGSKRKRGQAASEDQHELGGSGGAASPIEDTEFCVEIDSHPESGEFPAESPDLGSGPNRASLGRELSNRFFPGTPGIQGSAFLCAFPCAWPCSC